MKRRHPETSYGYTPPRSARVERWQCLAEQCGRDEWVVPRRWRRSRVRWCRHCGGAADPVFAEPWAHDAKGRRLQHELVTGADPYRRKWAEFDLAKWCWEDARRRADPDEEERSREQLLHTIDRHRTAEDGYHRAVLDRQAIELGDLDAAAGDILAWRPELRTVDLDSDRNSHHRVETRRFVSLCIDFLSSPASIGHPSEAAVREAMEGVAAGAETVLMAEHEVGFKGLKHMRASTTEAGRLAAEERSRFPAGSELSRARRGFVRNLSRRRSTPVRDGERAVARARSGASTEDLPGVIATLSETLTEASVDGVAHLRAAIALANAAVAINDLHGDAGALVEAADRLDTARPRTDGIRTLACLLRARACLSDETGNLDAADQALRDVVTTTDELTRALRSDIHATLAQLGLRRRPASFDEAIEECRAGREVALRRWRHATSADLTLARLLISHALEPDTNPAGRAAELDEAIRLARRQGRPWHCGGIAARLILNAARCARDAVTGGLDIPARRDGWRRAADRAGVAPAADRAQLAAAWVAWAVTTDDVETAAEAYAHLMSVVPLDAATRYLSGAKDKVLAAVQEHTEEAGYWLCRARRYREAVVALETGRAIRLSETIAAETGVDPAAGEIGYGAVTAVTGDGAIVYIAAAKAGGYALVVAASHDPQYFDLPRYDRATISGLLDAFDLETWTEEESLQPMEDALRWLWENGLRELVFLHARGRVVTLIPVGLLGLLPLHAGGAPKGTAKDPNQWHHTGTYSAIRYAPNARSLLRSKEMADRTPGAGLSLLAADVPEGHGYPRGQRLRHVSDETDEVVRSWKHSGPAIHLHRCNWPDFRAAAGDSDVWHLACHGQARPGDILRSTLHFADATITLAELRTELRPARRRLAVLSSCESHRTGTTHPNEMVGLPAALIEIGFAGVVATSWPVADAPTACLVARFYQLWRHDRFEPPVALNLAQQWLRSASWEDLETVFPDVPWDDRATTHPYEHPRHWAAFAFTGA